MSGSTKFCKSCFNLMMPREERGERKLVFHCKSCNVSQDAHSAVVYRNEVVKSETDQLAKVPDDVITDPTLERTRVICKKCGHDTAVMIIPPVGPSDTLMKLILVCTRPDCVHKWLIPEPKK